MVPARFEGVLVPVLTPFKSDLTPDKKKFVALCKWMLKHGATGLAVFGTTSEANSLSIEERVALLEALIDGGVDPNVLMPGAGCCSLADNVRLANHAASKGVKSVLMLPPFYYKGVSDDGIFNMFAETIARLDDKSMKIYVYHIPPQTVIGFSIGLLKRLQAAFPDTIVGIKDSGGDWNNTQAVIDNVPGFTVFPGSEPFLLQAMRAGGAGCITASGNINPTDIRKVYDNWQTPEADALQARITEIRGIVQGYPMVPALKAILAHFWNDPEWATVRPPLVRLTENKAAELVAKLKAANWAPPNP